MLIENQEGLIRDQEDLIQILEKKIESFKNRISYLETKNAEYKQAQETWVRCEECTQKDIPQEAETEEDLHAIV